MRQKKPACILQAMLTIALIFGIACKTGDGSGGQDGNGNNGGNGADNAFYVSPSGSDDNPGTKESPWRTIQKAADTLKAGETVYIRAGTYEERVVPKNSGSAASMQALSTAADSEANHITYAAYENETVTIDGQNVTLPDDWGGLFEISGKRYIKVSGLRIINAGPDDNHCGILVENSRRIVIEKCYTYNTASSGIGVWDCKDIVIDGNEVELACNDGEQECITVAQTDGFEVKNNHVHHSGPGSIGGEGLDAKDGSANGKLFNNRVHHIKRLGIYIDAWDKHTFNIEVYGNIVYRCEADGFALAAENGGLLENVRLYNNIAYDNGYSGIVVAGWGERGASHPMKDLFIINNTLYNNGGQDDWGGGISIENGNIDNLVVRNNICSKNHLFQLAVEVSNPGFLTADHNLIHGFRGYGEEIYGDDAVTGDPLFVNPAAANFRLQAGSPAIDSGSADGAPTTDFEGTSRPQGSGYDIGAFEYK